MNRNSKFCWRIAGWSVAAILLAASHLAFAADAKKKVEIKIRPIDPTGAAKVSFTRDIKPILINNCVECHSVEDRKSNFEVTSVETLQQKGKKAGPGVIPGKPDESAVVQYIRGLADAPQMPKGQPLLNEDELHLIRSWIAAGAMDDSQKPGDASAKKNSGEKISEIFAPFSGTNTLEKFYTARAERLKLLSPAPPLPTANLLSTNPIDQFIAAKWSEAKLPEAKRTPLVCDDSIFVRRVYLDLIGLIPTAAEAQKFIASHDPAKRAQLVDELLARTDDYAAHWTPFWEEAISSATTDVTGGIGSRGNHRDWILQSFKENKPFDLFVAELIDPTLPGYRKPVIREANTKRVVAAYIKNENHMDTLQSAANVAQVFLGTGMKCASCHSHFLNKEWPQARFLAFAGMLAPHDLELIRCEKKSGQFIPAQFPFELPQAPHDAPTDVNARQHLVAQLLIDPTNPRFAKAIVNRLWKRYLGLGLFEPIDDFRLDQPPSHPELLAWLADDFMRHGYDLKHTIRLILTSRTYQLRYDPALEDHFDVQRPGVARYFRSPSLRRLTAEQLLDSVRVATTQKIEPKNRLYLETTTTSLSRALSRPASRSEISTARSDDVAVVQALEVLNGEEFFQRVHGGEILGQLTGEKNFERIIEQLYWSILSRAPTAKERKAGVKFLKENLAAAPARGRPVRAKTDMTGETSSELSTNKFAALKNESAKIDSVAGVIPLGNGKKKQHFTLGAKEPLTVGPEDILFVEVSIDAKNPPQEILAQWNSGELQRRGFWGAQRSRNTPTRIGPVPKAGGQKRLEISARDLGIYTEQTGVIGWFAVGSREGGVTWGKASVIKKPAPPIREPLGDVMWALFASPEFQYIR